MDLRDCPNCKIPPSMFWDHEWQVVCHNCYDADCVGDPPQFVSGSLHALAPKKEDAIEDWNEQVANELCCEYCEHDAVTTRRDPETKRRERLCEQCAEDFKRGDGLTARERFAREGVKL